MSRPRVRQPGLSRSAPARRREHEGYATVSTRPLHILVFLLPLIILHEIGSAFYLSDGAGRTVETIRAHRMLDGFFQVFGVGALYLPGALLVVALLVWHLLLRDRWRVSIPVLATMLAESALWTIPLVVLAQIVSSAAPGAPELASLALLAESDAHAPAERSASALLTLSIGAGLYEELLFRMLGIALLHFVLADLLGLRPKPAGALAVFGSAVAFAVYHLGPGESIQWAVFIFQFLAGLYFGAIYVWRGFGIVVAVHALYDVVALVLQR